LDVATRADRRRCWKIDGTGQATSRSTRLSSTSCRDSADPSRRFQVHSRILLLGIARGFKRLSISLRSRTSAAGCCLPSSSEARGRPRNAGHEGQRRTFSLRRRVSARRGPGVRRFPLVKSVFDFSDDVEFLWFALRGDETEGDIEVEMRTIANDQDSTFHFKAR